MSELLIKEALIVAEQYDSKTSGSFFGNTFSLFKQTFQEWLQDKAPQLGAALAYYTVFSLAPLILVLRQKPTLSDLGLHWRGSVSSFWILPAAAVAATAGILVARAAGTFHELYKPDLAHVGGYVLWTIYQQFLLQDYFMPRLARVLKADAAIAFAAVLFAMAHLPNVVLTVATLVWGAVSCALFRRCRSVVVLGITQGLLGLCFAVCVPDAYLHHMRVGLGYWHYHPPVAGHYAGYSGK